jgi:hypothetical protein
LNWGVAPVIGASPCKLYRFSANNFCSCSPCFKPREIAQKNILLKHFFPVRRANEKTRGASARNSRFFYPVRLLKITQAVRPSGFG